jgi:hypothetical protein
VEPALGSGDKAQGTVWYKVTATAAGTITFSTASSDFNTVLSVYADAGSAKTFGGTLLGENDDCTPVVATSCVTVTVTKGQKLAVRVVGANGAVGNFLLSATAGATTGAPRALRAGA